MITKEHLDKRRLHQQKEHFGSEARAMFVNGVFTSDNWNGGDGLIRQYFYDFCYEKQKRAEIECKFGDSIFEGDVIINHTWFNDQNYVTIIFDGWLYKSIEDEIGIVINDIVYFTWYKNRGRTENALYNSEPMTEEQYLFVLNALEKTGFKFNLD